MAKRIRVTDDAGSTWWTLPGNTGERRGEASVVNDTIFGQDYESNQPSLMGATITANGILKGVAGYQTLVRKGGTPTAMTGEATTDIGSSLAFQITNSAKRLIDLATPLIVNVSGSPVTNYTLIDFLNGIVYFAAPPGGAVTLTGAYLPLVTIAAGRSFNLTQTSGSIDTTDYETAQANNGVRTYSEGLKTVSLEIGGIKSISNTFWANLMGRTLVYVDICPSGDNLNFFRGYFKPHNTGEMGNNGELEEENVTFGLYVPEGDTIYRPFSWYFPSGSAMSRALRIVLNAWQNRTPIGVQYLHDGTNGQQNLSAIVTEASLANALDGLNEFRFTFLPSGALTTVGTG
jgi:hypothetical protein